MLQQRLDAPLGAGPAWSAPTKEPPSSRLQPWRDRAVTADSSGEVRIWDVPAARLLRTLKSPRKPASSPSTPSGRFLATGPEVGTPRSRCSCSTSPLRAPRSRCRCSSTRPPSPQRYDVQPGRIVARQRPRRKRHTVEHGGPALDRASADRSPPGCQVAFTPDGDLLSTSARGSSSAGRCLRGRRGRAGALVAARRPGSTRSGRWIPGGALSSSTERFRVTKCRCAARRVAGVDLRARERPAGHRLLG